MTVASILVVDADPAARTPLVLGLRELGHEVSASGNAVSALAAVRASRPDLMVCNCSLPDLAGLELLTDVRRDRDLRAMRVLMTSDRDNTDDVVSSLQCGADDFVGKPIVMGEFLARVDACLRRPANVHTSETVTAGGITIDTVGQRVRIDGSYASLAPREYRLLLFMLTNQDRVFTRGQLLMHVWGQNSLAGPRTVDVHVRRLRRVLEPSDYAAFLQTVRGSGYRFSSSL